MRLNGFVCGVIFVFGYATVAFCQDDPKPWEKYGLSQTEWRTIADSSISMNKVEELLRSGISVTEYAGKPWKGLNMNENAWIQKRRLGESQYDI